MPRFPKYAIYPPLSLGAIVLLLSGFSGPDLIERDCKITDRGGLSIYLVKREDAQLTRVHQHVIYMDAKGITVAIGSDFYAPDWSDVKSISMDPADLKSGSGIMNFEYNDGNSQRIGRIDMNCWNLVEDCVKSKAGSQGADIKFIVNSGLQ
jgi:hypothetical protein